MHTVTVLFLLIATNNRPRELEGALLAMTPAQGDEKQVPSSELGPIMMVYAPPIEAQRAESLSWRASLRLHTSQ